MVLVMQIPWVPMLAIAAGSVAATIGLPSLSLPTLPPLLNSLGVMGGLGLLLLAAGWLLFAIVLCRFYKAVSRWRKAQASALSRQKEADERILVAAIEVGGATALQSAYLRDFVLAELERLTKEYSTAKTISFWLGLGTLVGAALSSLITGANLSFPGGTTVGSSFLVTSFGSFAGALAVFGNWQDTSTESLYLARMVRLEVWQWVGGSQEYAGIDEASKWLKLTSQVESLLSQGFAKESVALTRRSKSASKDGEKEEKNEAEAPCK